MSVDIAQAILALLAVGDIRMYREDSGYVVVEVQDTKALTEGRPFFVANHLDPDLATALAGVVAALPKPEGPPSRD